MDEERTAILCTILTILLWVWNHVKVKRFHWLSWKNLRKSNIRRPQFSTTSWSTAGSRVSRTFWILLGRIRALWLCLKISTGTIMGNLRFAWRFSSRNKTRNKGGGTTEKKRDWQNMNASWSWVKGIWASVWDSLDLCVGVWKILLKSGFFFFNRSVLWWQENNSHWVSVLGFPREREL